MSMNHFMIEFEAGRNIHIHKFATKSIAFMVVIAINFKKSASAVTSSNVSTKSVSRNRDRSSYLYLMHKHILSSLITGGMRTTDLYS